MSASNFPDDVEIVKLDLTNLSGSKKPIGPQVLSFRIQEDVSSSYVFAEFDIMDGIGLLQTFPIIGEEIIDVEVRFPSLNKSLSYKLAVFATSSVAYGPKNNINTYTLKCVSEEAMRNASSLAVKGYSDTYSNIIADVVKTYLKSSKKIDSVPTRGNHNIVLPNIKPLSAIDMLRKRSTSSRNEYAPMLFFETSEGYVFKDIVTLFEAGKSKPLADITYTYNNTAITNGKQTGLIMSFGTMEKSDTFHKINNGGLNNTVSTFDVITKKYTTYKYDYTSKKSKFNHFNQKSAHTEQFVSKYGNEPSRTYMVVVDSTKPDYFIDKHGDKQAYANIIFQNFSRAELSGMASKSILKAGDVVYLSLEKETALYDKTTEKTDKAASGYYFVKKLIHEIQLTAGIPIYRTSCDLISGLMLEKLK